ncbi:MAG: DUF475 domain-containing protein [Campylobacterales bacterium]
MSASAKPILSYFTSFFWVWAVATALLYLYGGLFAVYQGTVLSVLELSLSFDNAVVNALILSTMALIWRKRFLLWGMIIAVFGVRFIFPIMIVYFSTDLSFFASFELAINNPKEYERLIGEAHHTIMSFGGMFLFMLFVKFLFDEEKELHWIAIIEKYTSRMAKIGDLRMITILALMLAIAYAAPSIVPINGHEIKVDKAEILAPMLIGMIIFYAIEFLKGWMEKTKEEKFEGHGSEIATGGFVSFIYLELIDMSFSLDGVLGAFAVTQNVVIIMLGLGIGAMAVRSLTLYMVDREVTSKYVYLEHGAMWSIGFLSLSMIIQIFVHLPEAVVTTIAIVPITLAFIHSIYRNRQLLQD